MASITQGDGLGRIERLEKLVGRALASAAAALAALGGHTIQAGTGQLVGGTVTIPGVIITTTSRILVAFNTSNAGVNANSAKLEVPAAARVVSSTPTTADGSFDVTALTIGDAPNATDVSTFDWIIIN